MKPDLRKYAGAKVPRYTSYPTVPDFQKDFQEATYRAWLGAIDRAEPVSLYLHLPFCRQMCWYCGCNMKLAARYDPVAAYVTMLIKEIELVRQALPGRLKVSHLHWGGGTPTALEPDDLERVMALLHETFDLDAGAELAIESDPRTLTDAMIRRIGALGFTRASFGVQEFDPDVQAAINRIQPPDMVRRAVDGLREAGVGGINFDLIYGLPHQSVDKLVRTIEICKEMRPDRIALFGYAHVPWMAKNQRMIKEDALPDSAARLAQAKAAAEALEAAGYVPIGLDHFALPEDGLARAAWNGMLRRNFQGYTTDQAETLIGFGATSIGRTPFGYVQNIAETGAWGRQVEAGLLPVAKGHALTADDRLRAHVIERIMCAGAVDTREAAARFGLAADWCRDELLRLLPLAGDGLLEVEDGRVRLTPAGRPLARIAAAIFDSYRQHATSRHSVAV